MSDNVPTYPQTEVVTDLVTDGANEVQKVTLTSLSDGTFSLSFDGETTISSLSASSTAADIQAALENVSNLNPGDVSVSGSPGGPFTVTFGGARAKQNVPALSVTATKGAPTVTTVTAGAPDQDNADAVQRGIGNADRTADVSPLEGLSPVEQREANGSDYGDS